MTALAMDIGTLIEQIPGVNGGKPFVSEAGVSVHQISIMANDGMTPAEIADSYDGLTLAGVHAALACYFANQAAIDAEIAESVRLYYELAAQHPNGWRVVP
jgi:uncharacterized protein (DUF433 family)